MVELERLVLWGNDLTGTIPAALGRLTHLEYLVLSSNELDGEIPPELGSLLNLRILFLYNNQLVGRIPTALADLRRLERLTLARNNLTGSIPPELGRLRSLQYFSVSRNDLTGTIPPELGALEQLHWLYLWGNQLSGSIPEEFGDLERLFSLYLHDNELEGSLPPSLANIIELSYLRVDENAALTGPIPQEFVALDLDRFHWNDTGLCSPDSDHVRAWLESIDDHEGGRVCVRTYQTGDTISTLPTGLWTPDAVSDASFQSSGGQVTITFSDGGYIEEADTRYTCTASGGCRIVGRVVAQGTIEVVDVGDRDVLVALYEATDGPNWVDNTNWLTDAALGDWYGVDTDGSGRVVRLDLSGQRNRDTEEPVPHGLVGTIPAELDISCPV